MTVIFIPNIKFVGYVCAIDKFEGIFIVPLTAYLALYTTLNHRGIISRVKTIVEL